MGRVRVRRGYRWTATNKAKLCQLAHWRHEGKEYCRTVVWIVEFLPMCNLLVAVLRRGSKGFLLDVVGCCASGGQETYTESGEMGREGFGRMDTLERYSIVSSMA